MLLKGQSTLKADIGKWSVKKINAVNVKKILLSECGTNIEPKQQY
jgi:hypothetical protein